MKRAPFGNVARRFVYNRRLCSHFGIAPTPTEEIMSDAHSESPIKTPNQLIATIIASFAVPILIIVLLVSYVGNTSKTGSDRDAQSPEAIAKRIQPVADQGYRLAGVSDQPSADEPSGNAKSGEQKPVALKSGEQVYTAVCAACHNAGVAGSPKLGDAGAWKARLGQGYDTLVSHAVNGIRGMPAKGGNPNLNDVEVARAVVHMANASGAKFKEPK
jgi:cytochrome c5